MPTSEIFHYTEAELVSLCNRIREIVAEDMCQLDFLTEEEKNVYLKNRVLIGYKPSWFGRIWTVLNKLPILKEEQLLIAPITIGTNDSPPPEGSTSNNKKEGTLIKIFPKIKK